MCHAIIRFVDDVAEGVVADVVFDGSGVGAVGVFGEVAVPPANSSA
jgi:hypothetical protein